MKTRNLVLMMIIAVTICSQAAWGETTTYGWDTNLFYRTDTAAPLTDYMKARCYLDVYYPEHQKGFATVVWFSRGWINVR